LQFSKYKKLIFPASDIRPQYKEDGELSANQRKMMDAWLSSGGWDITQTFLVYPLEEEPNESNYDNLKYKTIDGSTRASLVIDEKSK
jgi:hypothetical protein